MLIYSGTYESRFVPRHQTGIPIYKINDGPAGGLYSRVQREPPTHTHTHTGGYLGDLMPGNAFSGYIRGPDLLDRREMLFLLSLYKESLSAAAARMKPFSRNLVSSFMRSVLVYVMGRSLEGVDCFDVGSLKRSAEERGNR